VASVGVSSSVFTMTRSTSSSVIDRERQVGARRAGRPADWRRSAYATCPPSPESRSTRQRCHRWCAPHPHRPIRSDTAAPAPVSSSGAGPTVKRVALLVGQHHVARRSPTSRHHCLPSLLMMGETREGGQKFLFQEESPTQDTRSAFGLDHYANAFTVMPDVAGGGRRRERHTQPAHYPRPITWRGTCRIAEGKAFNVVSCEGHSDALDNARWTRPAWQGLCRIPHRSTASFSRFRSDGHNRQLPLWSPSRLQKGGTHECASIS